jgi:hypothetical protein
LFFKYIHKQTNERTNKLTRTTGQPLSEIILILQGDAHHDLSRRRRRRSRVLGFFSRL